ncbi:MAG TPA: metalloregulator ArsR/SmtB family transcription factor [Planctomycetota bacterium]|nr:metalloregulator ArsR/SmtB family transcription factor [Planctomycetota bacterium]
MRANASDPRGRLEAVDEVFAALAHPARRQIVMTVHFWGGAMAAGQIAKRFGCAWPTTTRHLRVLETAGLLSQRRVGRTRLYRLERSRLKLVRDWLDWLEPPTRRRKGERR